MNRNWKRFLLSLLATTASIVLTFGIAAIVDHNKARKEKREIVMMVMYDMYNSLESIEKANANILKSMDIQCRIAEDTSRYKELRFDLMRLLPIVDYTETTEHIFSSSIETINTVGNVLFTENVAEFYQGRKYYREVICDSIGKRVMRNAPFRTVEGALGFDYFSDGLTSQHIVWRLQSLYEQCQLMMGVTDEEMAAYREKRLQIIHDTPDHQAANDSTMNELLQLKDRLEEATGKLKF